MSCRSAEPTLPEICGGRCGPPASRALSGAGWLEYGLGAAFEPAAGVTPGTAPAGMLLRVTAGTDRPLPRSRGGERLSASSGSGRAAYEGSVGRVLGLIRAGDIYQANIAHRLTAPFRGRAEELFAALAGSARPLFGLYARAEISPGVHRAVLSLSPELFLRFDAGTRELVTRPMKGTRPGDADPRELLDAPKDRAELAMIVDLMRNDLGRVCEFGSVRVDRSREIERHASGGGAVLQATATVRGRVREGLDAADILGATFPPGTVTGAPKVRAMQVIDAEEPFERGPYCGCVGMFSDDGSFELGVAIRTAVITGSIDPGSGEFVDAELTYAVGAGIVADSDPRQEWLETLAKARVLEPCFVVPRG